MINASGEYTPKSGSGSGSGSVRSGFHTPSTANSNLSWSSISVQRNSSTKSNGDEHWVPSNGKAHPKSSFARAVESSGNESPVMCKISGKSMVINKTLLQTNANHMGSPGLFASMMGMKKNTEDEKKLREKISQVVKQSGEETLLMSPAVSSGRKTRGRVQVNQIQFQNLFKNETPVMEKEREKEKEEPKRSSSQNKVRRKSTMWLKNLRNEDAVIT